MPPFSQSEIDEEQGAIENVFENEQDSIFGLIFVSLAICLARRDYLEGLLTLKQEEEALTLPITWLQRPHPLLVPTKDLEHLLPCHLSHQTTVVHLLIIEDTLHSSQAQVELVQLHWKTQRLLVAQWVAFQRLQLCHLNPCLEHCSYSSSLPEKPSMSFLINKETPSTTTSSLTSSEREADRDRQ